MELRFHRYVSNITLPSGASDRKVVGVQVPHLHQSLAVTGLSRCGFVVTSYSSSLRRHLFGLSNTNPDIITISGFFVLKKLGFAVFYCVKGL